jgi:predicted nuclease of predicted toxin-antitoxin system
VLKGYADEHVNAAIVRALRLREMDVVTVQERQGEGTDDPDVLAEALRDERVLLTCDEDFLVLAAEYTNQGRVFAPIFYWPQSERRVGTIMRSILHELNRKDYAAACSQVYFL